MTYDVKDIGARRSGWPGRELDYDLPRSLTVNIQSICTILLLFLVMIVALHCLGQTIRFLYGYDYALGFVPLFNMYGEQNVPTWFSSLLLLTCSGLLYVIASAKRGGRDSFHGYWLLLCLIFLFLSVDETAMIHEKIGGLMHRILPGNLLSAWIIPYSILGVVLGVLLIRFFFSIPGKYRALFFLSGILYVGGTVGLEVFEAIHIMRGGKNDPTFMVLVTIEETMEAGALILFSYSLLTYIKEHIRTLQIRVG